MTSRMSRGCMRCRTRKVKCDEGRPSCRRCIQRNEICVGYRDEASLLFRSENEKAARSSVPRRVASQSTLKPGISSYAQSVPQASREISSAYDPSDLLSAEISGLNLSNPVPWAKTSPPDSAPSAEDQAVSQFFERFVMYPCNHGSSPGFLENLPGLFHEVNMDHKLPLRWAVRAAAYASLSSDQKNVALYQKALHCYGLALSALRDALADYRTAADDFILMTVVVLDLFETIYLQDSVSLGSHTEGMAQILRLRGPNQIHNIRGWSLFRLSHHRLTQQSQQLIARQELLPESEAWLDSLNEDLPFVQIEKGNFEINKICDRARKLLKSIDNTELSAERTLEMIEEMHNLDQVATSWRHGPGWSYKTVHHSEITQDQEMASKFPEFVQLHQDVWIAYEWNYHRTARMIMHEHLLKCLARLQNLPAGKFEKLPALICSLQEASVAIIRALVDEILSTVPQSLGDIDHDGNILKESVGLSICKGVGGYFLLWPIKVSKSRPQATAEQRSAAQSVFERIREYTGMKGALGEASSI